MINISGAIAMNAQGVRFLCMGNLRVALCAFQEAFFMTKQSSVCLEHPLLVAATDDFPCPFQHNCKPIEHDSRVSFIYDRPIFVCAETPPLDHPSFNAFVQFVSSVVTFNFALACHRYGLTCGSDSFLKRAMNLYETTLNMVTADESDNLMMTVLECIVLNNLAQIYYHQCQYHESECLLCNMYDILMTTDSLELYLSAKEIESLIRNKLHMHPPAVACAA